MVTKTIKSRIQQKHDIEANWIKAVNFIPMMGELIVYDPDASHDECRLKIGDGQTLVNNLPFIEDRLIDLIDELSPIYTFISLPASSWSGDASPYSQVIEIVEVNENSKVDLDASPEVLMNLKENGITLMTANDEGVVTIYAFGKKPTVDYTVQAVVTKVAPSYGSDEWVAANSYEINRLINKDIIGGSW